MSAAPTVASVAELSIRACPFCGAESAWVTSEGESSPRAYFVQCPTCWACGPAAGEERYDRTADTLQRNRAIQKWNDRCAD